MSRFSVLRFVPPPLDSDGGVYVDSNGLLDPWSSGGVLSDVSKTAVAVLIPEGAHHLDLRASNALDPVSVRGARSLHRVSIKRWIAEYHYGGIAT